MLNLYKVDENYIRFLRSYDSKVTVNSDEKNARPYIGFLFEINGSKYYAPMTSPKLKHKTMKNGLDFQKINNGEHGAINFNNMIPIYDKFLTVVNINNEPDEKYKNLLMNQYRYINSNEQQLVRKAIKLYDMFISDKIPEKVKERCCNFTLLEKNSKEYIVQHNN